MDGLACRTAVRRIVECDNAWRLQGKLMLVMGEMDKNVDPSSTLQVVDPSDQSQ